LLPSCSGTLQAKVDGENVAAAPLQVTLATPDSASLKLPATSTDAPPTVTPLAGDVM
jgi:hypothetical protein